jgi:hypothetical protein
LGAKLLARREDCKPENHFSKLEFLVDPCKNTVSWFLDGDRVHRVSDLGYRPLEQDRVIDWGGLVRPVQLSSAVRVGFFHMTWMDAGLPNNYARQHVDDCADALNKTHLMPVLRQLPSKKKSSYNYYNEYHNKSGVQVPLRDEAWCLTKYDAKKDNFGQGALTRVRYLKISYTDNCCRDCSVGRCGLIKCTDTKEDNLGEEVDNLLREAGSSVFFGEFENWEPLKKLLDIPNYPYTVTVFSNKGDVVFDSAEQPVEINAGGALELLEAYTKCEGCAVRSEIVIRNVDTVCYQFRVFKKHYVRVVVDCESCEVRYVRISKELTQIQGPQVPCP